MNKLMSKSELIQEIAEEHSGKLTRNDVKGVLASLTNVGYRDGPPPIWWTVDVLGSGYSI